MKNFKCYICDLLKIIVILLVFGCKKENLERKSDLSLTVPSTYKDFQALLDNMSVMNAKSVTLGEVASDGHIVSEATWISAGMSLYKSAYTWTNDQPNISLSNWNLAYERILYCNVVIDGLSNKSTDDLEYRDIMGQALFQRAKCFYELAQVFASPYKPGDANLAPGIPLKLGSDITIKTVRSTLAETYSQIINDLDSAKALLPIDAAYKTRASKTAALAMLARVYLSMEDYSKAYECADLTLNLKNDLLDYSTINTTLTYPMGLFNKEVIFHSTLTVGGPLNRTTAIIEPALYLLYHNNDLRRSVFFTTSAGNIIFRGMYYNSSQQFNGLATDEIYLIRAECFARAGNKELAMKDLNDLLRTRWSKQPGKEFQNLTAATAIDALDQVLLERKKELLLRGLRWSDLRRLNRDDRYKLTLYKTIGGKTYTLEPNSYKYTFPIPDDIIQIAGISQNEGW